MSPALTGLLMTLCLVGAIVGTRMLRSTPQGAVALVAPDDGEGRPTLVQRLQLAAGRRFAPSVLAAMSPRRRETIRHRLDAAGRPDGMDLRAYAARKAAQTATGLVVGTALGLVTNPLLILALGALGFIWLDLRLVRAAKERQERIDRDLPDFLDVLTVTVGAGLGFRNALDRVSSELEGPLSEEVQTVLRQLSLGSSRRVAFEGLRERNDSETLQTFVTALLHAEELGTPLGDTLSSIATDMRREFAQNARRRAARAEPRISVVVTLVIGPAAIMLILGGLFLGSNFSAPGALFGGG